MYKKVEKYRFIYYNVVKRWIMSKSRVIETIFILLTVIALITFILPSYVYADTPALINPGDWEPSNTGDMQQITDSAGIIVSAIRVIGIVVTVVVLMILGIKYMVGSLEERAEYKKSMKAYLIGVVMFFALSQIIPIIIDLASAFDT